MSLGKRVSESAQARRGGGVLGGSVVARGVMSLGKRVSESA